MATTIAAERVDGVSAAGGPGRAAALWVSRAILLVWAGFWSWFAIAVAAHEGWGSAQYAAMVGVPAWAVVMVAWRWPRVGGAIAIMGGAVLAAVFTISTTPLILGAPLALAGVLAVVGGWRRNR